MGGKLNRIPGLLWNGVCRREEGGVKASFLETGFDYLGYLSYVNDRRGQNPVCMCGMHHFRVTN